MPPKISTSNNKKPVVSVSHKFRRIDVSKEGGPEYLQNTTAEEMHSHAKLCVEALNNGPGHTPRTDSTAEPLGLGFKALLSVAPADSCMNLCIIAMFTGTFPPIRWQVCTSKRDAKPLSLSVIPATDAIGSWLNSHWLVPSSLSHETKNSLAVPLFAKIGAVYIYAMEEKEIFSAIEDALKGATGTGGGGGTTTLGSLGHGTRAKKAAAAEESKKRRWKFSGSGFAGCIATCCALLMPANLVDSLVTFGSPPSLTNPDGLFSFPHSHIHHTVDLEPHMLNPRVTEKVIARLEGLGFMFPYPPTSESLTGIVAKKLQKASSEGPYSQSRTDTQHQQQLLNYGIPSLYSHSPYHIVVLYPSPSTFPDLPESVNDILFPTTTMYAYDFRSRKSRSTENAEPVAPRFELEGKMVPLDMRVQNPYYTVKDYYYAFRMALGKSLQGVTVTTPIADGTITFVAELHQLGGFLMRYRLGEVVSLIDGQENKQLKEIPTAESEQVQTMIAAMSSKGQPVTKSSAPVLTTKAVSSLQHQQRQDGEQSNPQAVGESGDRPPLPMNPLALDGAGGQGGDEEGRDDNAAATAAMKKRDSLTGSSVDNNNELSKVEKKTSQHHIEGGSAAASEHAPTEGGGSTPGGQSIASTAAATALDATNGALGGTAGAAVRKKAVLPKVRVKKKSLGPIIPIELVTKAELLFLKYPKMIMKMINAREKDLPGAIPRLPESEVLPPMSISIQLQVCGDTVESLANYLRQYRNMTVWDARLSARQLLDLGGIPPLRSKIAQLFMKTHSLMFLCSVLPKQVTPSTQIATAVAVKAMDKVTRKLLFSPEGYHLCWNVAVASTVRGVGKTTLMDLLTRDSIQTRAMPKRKLTDDMTLNDALFCDAEYAMKVKWSPTASAFTEKRVGVKDVSQVQTLLLKLILNEERWTPANGGRRTAIAYAAQVLWLVRDEQTFHHLVQCDPFFTEDARADASILFTDNQIGRQHVVVFCPKRTGEEEEEEENDGADDDDDGDEGTAATRKSPQRKSVSPGVSPTAASSSNSPQNASGSEPPSSPKRKKQKKMSTAEKLSNQEYPLEVLIQEFCNRKDFYFIKVDVTDDLSITSLQRLLVQWMVPHLRLPIDPRLLPPYVDIGQLYTACPPAISDYLRRTGGFQKKKEKVDKKGSRAAEEAVSSSQLQHSMSLVPEPSAMLSSDQMQF